jgi:hypothetical protein
MHERTKKKASAVKVALVRPLIPNATTIAAIKEARRGAFKRYRSIGALLMSLNAGE